MDGSNTVANSKPGKPFQKGDTRINRKGRPKSFDALRELAQQIAHEEAKGKDQQPLVINGRVVTVTEAILRQWAMSKDAKLQQAFIEVAYGKVPQRTELSGPDNGPIRAQVDFSKLTDEQVTALISVAETLGIED